MIQRDCVNRRYGIWYFVHICGLNPVVIPGLRAGTCAVLRGSSLCASAFVICEIKDYFTLQLASRVSEKNLCVVDTAVLSTFIHLFARWRFSVIYVVAVASTAADSSDYRKSSTATTLSRSPLAQREPDTTPLITRKFK